MLVLTISVNTHPEQWAAIYAAVPGEQLGVRCLAQGHLQFLPARDSSSQPFDYESNSLTIRPRLPHRLCSPHTVSRLVTVLDEADQCGVVCKLQELDRGVFRCAVVRVEGEEQWGENAALRSSSTPVLMVQVLDENFPSLNSCCLSVRKLVIH